MSAAGCPQHGPPALLGRTLAVAVVCEIQVCRRNFYDGREDMLKCLCGEREDERNTWWKARPWNSKNLPGGLCGACKELWAHTTASIDTLDTPNRPKPLLDSQHTGSAADDGLAAAAAESAGDVPVLVDLDL